MARAHLNIQQEVIDAFLTAQESKNVRLIKVQIQDEDLILAGVLDKSVSAAADFDELLKESLSPTQATIALFNLSDHYDSQQWVLVAWVPDGCRVRDKMLYSSSREDLKRNLGIGYFKSEFCANELSDISWDHYLESQRSDVDTAMLTETERLVLEEKVMSHSEASTTKTSALGVIPFQLSPEAKSALESFQSGASNWIELTVDGEVVQLVSEQSIDTSLSLASHIDTENARFIIGKFARADGTNFVFFVFSCPENVSVRAKMTMSSSKASVLASAAENALVFDKVFEVRDAADLDDYLQLEKKENEYTSLLQTTSSAAASLSHAKPVRPGRGKAKVGKFVADDE